MGITSQSVDRSTKMGATLLADGATFRTWAPRARAVFLTTGPALAASATPGWTPSPADALADQGDGTWAGFLAGAQDGLSYMFWIVGPTGGSAGPKRDPYARELTTTPAYPDCFCILRGDDAYPWHDADWRTPAFADLVIYQLHVGTWWATDGAGTDVRALRRGQFLDVVARLPYLGALGINAIQLLPVYTYGTPYSAGYNGVDYFSPESLYETTDAADLARGLAAANAQLAAAGAPLLALDQIRSGPDQLKCLIDLAHLAGIAVIFDLVYNHAGGDFGDRGLWFYDRAAGSRPEDSLYFTPEGWAGGQVFDYSKAPVRQFLIDNALFYLKNFRIDGIRYDEVRVISNNRPAGRTFCQDITGTVRFVHPTAIQIAEYWEWDRAAAVTAPPDGLGFDAELGDGLRDRLRDLLTQLTGGESATINLDPLAASLSKPIGFSADWRLIQCIENHDKTYAGHDDSFRAAMLADPQERRSWYARSRCRAAAAVLFAAPGIPALFMGQEILEDKLWSDDDKDHPGHLIWWDGLKAADGVGAAYLRFMQDLVGLRRRTPALRAGGMRVSRVNGYDRIIVIHRWIDDGGPGQDVVAVVSFDENPKRGYPIGLPRGGHWAEAFNSDVYEGFANPQPVGNGGAVYAGGGGMDGFAHSARIDIAANGALFLTAG